MENHEWKEDIIVEGIDPLIYLIANKFYLTAKSLSNHFTEPIVVNIAFSIELYLKCLKTKTTYSKKKNTDSPILERKLDTIFGHNFVELFKKLKATEQNNLSIQYFEKHNSNLSQDFEEIKNAFIEYRYSFEKNSLSINLNILNRVADFLKEYIECEMRQKRYSR